MARSRLLGVYAHPDDETFCTGGTFAKYASTGCEIMVISATRGQAGQIRSAALATRATLSNIRERELRLACERVGVEHVACWDYVDGTLQDIDAGELEERITLAIRTFRPDVVFTFGDDGAYGHPDHIAISRSTTAACMSACDPLYRPDERGYDSTAMRPPRLYHAAFPQRRLLLQDRLVKWLIEEGPDFRGDPEFVHGLLLLAEQLSSLHYLDDHFEVKWFPAGFPIVEQGEPATTLFLLLAGNVDVVREDRNGIQRAVARLEPGQFFGEQGIASGSPRNAHVIAVESAACLVLSPAQPTLFEGRGRDAALVSSVPVRVADVELSGVTTCIDVRPFIRSKLHAIAAYRSQFPIRADMLPESIFSDLFGREYFTRVLPARELETDFDLESEPS